jgi:hypothetical protein
MRREMAMGSRLNPGFEWLLPALFGEFALTFVLIAILISRLIPHFPIDQSRMTIQERQQLGFDLFARLFVDPSFKKERLLALLAMGSMALSVITLAVLVPLASTRIS